MPSKKMIGWATGIVLILGAGGFALAKYNTNSMAHVMYQRVFHHGKTSDQKQSAVKNISTTQKSKSDNSKTTGAIKDLLKNKNYSGAYLVVEDGKAKGTQYLGEHKNQLQGKYFQMADLENMVTAAAICKLVDQGKLSFATPVSKYYESLDLSDNVTVADLLNMTSGLQNDQIPNNQLTNVLNWNLNHVSLGTSGSYDYQEVNYVLLEGIISQVADQSYQDYIEQNILQPNNLDEVKFTSGVNDDQLATPYNGNQKVDSTTLAKAMNEQMGKNQLMATPAGMFKLTKTLIKDYGNDQHFVTTNSQNFTGQLITSDDYYYGSGGIKGYRTSIALSKDGQKGIILMSNDSNGKDNLTDLVKEAYQALN